MTILFGSIFIVAFILLARPVRRMASFYVLFLTLYITSISEIIRLYFSLNFADLFTKFLAYILIMVIPAVVLVLADFVTKRLIAAGVLLSFLVLLPFTRPTLAYARTAADWKIRYFPDRFAENLSRLPILSPINRGILITHRRKQGKKPALEVSRENAGRVQTTEFSPDKIRFLFRSADRGYQIELLHEMASLRKPVLVTEAISLITTDKGQLTEAAVEYLWALSGNHYLYDAGQWQTYFSKRQRATMNTVSNTSDQENSSSSHRQFSAVRTTAILRLVKHRDVDFFTFLLTDGPDHISETDIERYEQVANSFPPKTNRGTESYRKGMAFFFLALSETIWIAEGNFGDQKAVLDHWHQSVQCLNRAPELGADLAAEIEKMLAQADIDKNGQIDRYELEAIVTERVP